LIEKDVFNLISPHGEKPAATRKDMGEDMYTFIVKEADAVAKNSRYLL